MRGSASSISTRALEKLMRDMRVIGVLPEPEEASSRRKRAESVTRTVRKSLYQLKPYVQRDGRYAETVGYRVGAVILMISTLATPPHPRTVARDI